MATRTRSTRRRARFGALVTLAALWLSLASGTPTWAGTPVSLDDGASAPKAKPAAADTSKKAASKTAVRDTKTTAAPVATKSASQPASSLKVAPTTKTAVAPATRTASPTVAAKPVPPTTSTKGAPSVAKAGATVPNGVPRVASTSTSPSVAKTGTVAKIPAGSKVAPSAVASGTAKIARANPATSGPISSSKLVPAAMTPSISRIAPAKSPSLGSTLAKSGGTTVNAPATGTNRQGSVPSAGVTPLKSGAATKAAVGGVASAAAIKPAQGGKPGSPTTVGKSGVAVTAPLEDHVTYQYNALGRRDPFQSLMEGEYVGADVGGQAPPDLGGLKLVGVVWGSSDQFAMVEDVRGDGYVLRRGDRVMNGYVEGLKRDAMIVNITVDGQAQSVTIPITRKGEKSNANR